MSIRNTLKKLTKQSLTKDGFSSLISGSRTAKILPFASFTSSISGLERNFHISTLKTPQFLKKSSYALMNISSNNQQQRSYYNVYNYATDKTRITLPPSNNPSRKTLVLDLDEVLITQAGGYSDVVVTHDSCGHTITKRPGVDEFLLEMAKHFEIVLLTSSVKHYADINLEHLPDVFEHRRYRHDIPHDDGLKHVSSMGRDMDKIILIDDSTAHLEANPDNQILMPFFEIGKNDDNLKKLTEVLLKIAKDEVSIKEACQEWNKKS